MLLRLLVVVGCALALGCAEPLAPAPRVGYTAPNLSLISDLSRTYVFNATLYPVGSSKQSPIGHAQVRLVRSGEAESSYLATFSVILFADFPHDASSVGFFQMRVAIWDSGDYAGYGPDANILTFAGSAFLAESVAMQLIETPDAFSLQGFDAAGLLTVEGIFTRTSGDDPRS